MFQKLPYSPTRNIRTPHDRKRFVPPPSPRFCHPDPLCHTRTGLWWKLVTTLLQASRGHVQYLVCPPRASKRAARRRGMDSYSRWICWAVTLEKASWRADQRASRLENTCPINWRLTNGQTCSMGFMSGEFASQSPLLNIRTPLVRSQFLVARDVCTAAPSC